ncbi:VWD domain-containing protein, partial [Haemophilus parainfluenzae]|uniref:VWD domain-containing protein n=1 Tax=Haemophilus parainfluenzae TaxID=729 RepID=UPI00157E5475
ILTLEVENGYGALRWDGGSTQRYSGNFSGTYCVGDSCRCEDGSMPPGVESVPAQGLLAVTGYLDTGGVSLVEEESPCERREPDTGGGESGRSGGASSSGSGDRARGTSYGDPHIITYDGYRYCFQTAGEFLLSQSADGRFVVQARQKPVPGRQITLNSAVAMRIGRHRVGIYMQDAPDG